MADPSLQICYGMQCAWPIQAARADQVLSARFTATSQRPGPDGTAMQAIYTDATGWLSHTGNRWFDCQPGAECDPRRKGLSRTSRAYITWQSPLNNTDNVEIHTPFTPWVLELTPEATPACTPQLCDPMLGVDEPCRFTTFPCYEYQTCTVLFDASKENNATTKCFPLLRGPGSNCALDGRTAYMRVYNGKDATSSFVRK